MIIAIHEKFNHLFVSCIFVVEIESHKNLNQGNKEHEINPIFNLRCFY